MAQNITSANSSLRVTIATLYTAGVDVDQYEADRMFETAAVSNAEIVMGADGVMHAGWVPNPVELTINIMPNSNFGGIIDEVYAYENTGKVKLAVNAVLTLKSIGGAVYTFVGGVISNFTPSIAGARTLQGRPITITFESVTRS